MTSHTYKILQTKINEVSVIISIEVKVAWFPREQNQIVDYLNKGYDFDDWQTTDDLFLHSSSLWVPYTVDRFADSSRDDRLPYS